MTVVAVDGYRPITADVCHVIAEAGANHNNSVERAIEMATQAAAAGAWAIKFQLYKAESIAIRVSPKYWEDELGTATQFEAFERSDHLAYEDYAAVADACRDLGIVFFATPFDVAAVEALESMDVALYKVASGDITHRPLLEAIAATGKPVLLSTGASTAEEIERALGWTGLGPEKLVLLVCTLTYPAPDEDGHFARIETFRARFAPYLIGVSDHTLGVAGAWMTAALGGVCLEKHYTLDKTLPDVPDHRISLDPQELAQAVAVCTKASLLRGSPAIEVHPSEEPARRDARRSIVVERPVVAGQRLTGDDLAFKRPGIGLPPYEVGDVVGRYAKRALNRDHVLAPDDLGDV